MHIATLLLIILAAGLSSQWLAAQIRLPAIVVLISVGLILGPVTGIIQLTLSQTELGELIGLGVAIILFEGGMDLKTSEFRRTGPGIRRLTLLAPPLAGLVGGLGGDYVARPGWADLPAVRNGEVHAPDAGLARSLWDYTSMLYVAKRLHPDAFADADPVGELRRFHERFLPIAFEGEWMVRMAPAGA